MRRVLLFSLSLLGLLLALPSIASAQTVLTGQVTTESGGLTEMAHVHLYRMHESLGAAPIASVDVDEKGTYSIEIDEPGFYRLIVTGVDHDYVQIPVIVEQNDNRIDLDVALGSFTYVTEPESLQVIGDFNDFSFQDAREMERQEDGTWTYTYEATGETMSFQILGLTAYPATGRSVNLPGSTQFEYDGGGDYRSIERIRPGEVTIVVDPSTLPTGGSGLANVRFEDEERTTLQHLDFMWREAFDDFRRIVMAAREAEASGSLFEENPTDALRPLIDEGNHIIEMEHFSHRTKQMAALNVVRAMQYMPDPDEDKIEEQAEEKGHHVDLDDLLDRVDELLPPESDFWAADPMMAISRQIGHLEIEDADEMTERLLNLYEVSPVRDVRANALAQLLMGADYLGKTEIVEEYYPILLRDYRDVAGVSYILERLDPGRAIRVGNPVPDFAVTLEDGSGRTVTRASMLGKYYLIDFWATWCGPCVGEMPDLHEAYEEFASDDFEILSLSFDSDFSKVESFRENRYAMPWMHGFVEGGFRSDLAQAFEVQGIPKPILVDPEGMIVAVEGQLRGERLEGTLEGVLD